MKAICTKADFSNIVVAKINKEIGTLEWQWHNLFLTFEQIKELKNTIVELLDPHQRGVSLKNNN